MSSRFRTGPSSTSGSTSTRKRFRIVPLYFATERPVIVRGGQITLYYDGMKLLPGEEVRTEKVRMRSLGCLPCTGAIRSEADTLPKIIEEVVDLQEKRARKPRDRP